MEQLEVLTKEGFMNVLPKLYFGGGILAGAGSTGTLAFFLLVNLGALYRKGSSTRGSGGPVGLGSSGGL